MTDDWLSAAAEFKAKPKQAQPYRFVPGNQYRRRCSACGQYRLMAGGSGTGRNWICRTCRPRPAKAA